MKRFRYGELHKHLPALVRWPRSRRAERYLREHFPHAAQERRAKAQPRRRRDGMREYTITSIGTTRGAAVPFLRMSGRWLEQCGFSSRARVFVRVEPGRLVVTMDDPAIANGRESQG